MCHTIAMLAFYQHTVQMKRFIQEKLDRELFYTYFEKGASYEPIHVQYACATFWKQKIQCINNIYQLQG